MQNNDQSQIVGAIIIAGLLIAGAVLLKGSNPGDTGTQANNQTDLIDINIKPISDQDHILGDKNSKVVVIEYSDLECPFCKTFHKTMHDILTQYSSNVAWIYRQYPIPSLHPKAPHEAEASECAFEQGGNAAFWKYIDRILAITPSNNGLDEKELMNTADYIGLNSSSFYTCLQSGKYTDLIQTDMDDGNKAGVSGTPTSFIVGQKNITKVVQIEIEKAINSPGAVSFSSKGENIMRINGALPLDMVNKIITILLK